MSQAAPEQVIHTRIWLEEAEADNPFASRAAYCHGYDVYGEMLGQARWMEMLYLLFRAERPTPAETALLDALAVALANPGPRDPSIHAAMCGGIGGSTAAASLMAALAVGAGQYGGGREVWLAMQGWQQCGTELSAWQSRLAKLPEAEIDVWPAPEHPAGFDPNGVSTTTIVCQTLAVLARLSPGPRLPWLQTQRVALEQAAGLPLALTLPAAACLCDLGFNPAQGEMLYLLLRLPGAAAHALEQWEYGFKRFPFPPLELEDDPAQPDTKAPS
ncbi:citryl-CoA lyase [Chitinimonas arctica]|uniref:Citryl-CoA lyase n=1 Tax=Chitinimonas arctica TaxID=2594795 RepID=A0A516SAR6_9NEIS|nr:citryl-CoA lyase [Chitinimonas arctica]QDQ25254.1 citryl-CoA lyase [Chitinimonas arctica]